MRPSLLAVITLISLAACSSKNTATTQATNMTLDKTNTTLDKSSVPPVAAVSKWRLDSETLPPSSSVST